MAGLELMGAMELRALASSSRGGGDRHSGWILVSLEMRTVELKAEEVMYVEAA